MVDDGAQRAICMSELVASRGDHADKPDNAGKMSEPDGLWQQARDSFQKELLGAGLGQIDMDAQFQRVLTIFFDST
jgi:hypothetical protein